MSTVRALEQQLSEAKRAEAQERHRQFITKLSVIRKEKAEAIAEHAKLSEAVKAERLQRRKIQSKLEDLLFQIDESWRARPRVADYLPNDVEVARWRAGHTRLEAERDELFKQRDALPLIDMMVIVRLGARIEQLEFAEANTLAVLDGPQSSGGLEAVPLPPRGGLVSVRW